MDVIVKTEVLELISMLKFHIRFLRHIDLKDSEDLASSSKYHLQVLRLSLQESARRLRCISSKCSTISESRRLPGTLSSIQRFVKVSLSKH
jgi:hypothetical protein